jgi:AraC-like DNA-binding protein
MGKARREGERRRSWSLFDLEIPSATRIAYPLHAAVWEPRKPGPLTMDLHQGMELGIVLRGRMERHYEDFAFVAKPGDIHFCSAWEPHGWRVAAPNTSQVVIIFLPEVIDTDLLSGVPWLGFFTVPPRERPRVGVGKLRREVLEIGRRLRREGIDESSGWQASVRSLMFYLFVLLGRHWEPPRPPRDSGASAGSFARVMPAVELVHRDITRIPTLAKAAAACGLHRSRFGSLFKETMGVSFAKFRQRAQLAQVAQFLLTTKLSSEAIGEQTGFVDASHMHRTFVNTYGYTPGEYRRRNSES